MSHYETFVVRLWIEDSGEMAHGEVRHLTSGTGLRFRHLPQATKFIKEIAERRESSPSKSSQNVLVDFEGSSPEG
jgi:hypothetical protein